jgi:hypothetical protein
MFKINKKYCILLAIFVVGVFLLVIFLQNKKEILNQVNPPRILTDEEKAAIVKSLDEKAKIDPLSVSEKNKIIKDLKAKSLTSPQLTDAEKAAIVNSLR